VTTSKNPVLAAVEEIGQTFEDFKVRQDERFGELQKSHSAIVDRIETIEAGGDRPPKPAQAKAASPYRRIDTKAGPAFELTSKQRLQDVPELAKGSDGPGLSRILGALALGENCGDAEAIEAASELKSVGTGTSGVTLRNSVAAEWADLMRAQSIAFRAGARTVSMPEQTLSYIAVTADPTASWRSSEGASLSATDPTLAARTLTAKTIACRTQLSLEASMDVPDAGEMIGRTHAGAMAQALDQAIFYGSSPSPVGLQNNSDVPKVTSVGTPSDWTDILDGVQAYLNSNNALESLAICWHPFVWRMYAGLVTGISSDNSPLPIPPDIAGVPRYVSTAADPVTSPESFHITMGDFRDLVVGIRLEPSIRVLDATTSYASNLLVEVVGVMRADVVAVRPSSFVVMEDVTRT